jgi:tetratricopeptide (TPR) repeat protein
MLRKKSNHQSLITLKKKSFQTTDYGNHYPYFYLQKINMDVKDILIKAEQCALQNEYEKLVQLYKELLAHKPYQIDALINITDTLIRQNKTLEAEQFALDAYFLYKEIDDMTVVNYSCVLYQKNELDKAIQICEIACQQGSKNSLLYQNLGYYYMHKGRYQKALKCYNYAIKLSKNETLAFCNRGILRYFIFNDNGGIADLLKAHHLKDPEATEILQIIAKQRKIRLLKYSNMEDI